MVIKSKDIRAVFKKYLNNQIYKDYLAEWKDDRFYHADGYKRNLSGLTKYLNDIKFNSIYTILNRINHGESIKGREYWRDTRNLFEDSYRQNVWAEVRGNPRILAHKRRREIKRTQKKNKIFKGKKYIIGGILNQIPGADVHAQPDAPVRGFLE